MTTASRAPAPRAAGPADLLVGVDVGGSKIAVLVAGRERRRDLVERLRFQPELARMGHDRRPARHRLETAKPAAPARRPVVLDDDVPDFARPEPVTLVERPLQDDAGTDAAPHLDRHEVRAS